MRSEKLITVEGIKTYTLYETPSNGGDDSPLVLLSHALMANHHMYDSTVQALLSAGYRTLRYDHIGHNNSPEPPSGLSSTTNAASNTSPTTDDDDRLVTSVDFDRLTRQMHALVQNITKQSTIHAVIGCSMGGVLAIRYAQLYPDQISHVISMGMPGIKSLEAAKPLWSQRIEEFEKDVRAGTDELCRKTVQRWLPGNEERSVEARREALEEVRRCSYRGYVACADGIRGYDYGDQLSKVQAKTMVLAGDRDGACGPREGLEMVAEKIKGAEFVWFEGAGHLPPLHKREEFEELMLRFLKG